jgi:hypothetical protein
MNPPEDALQAALLAALAVRGVADSAALQVALGRSQPTVSRLLAATAAHWQALGAGRRTRYALPHTLLGLPGQQALHWVHEDGRIERWGRLLFIQGERVHVQADGVDLLVQGRLPWFLSTLRGEGFVGRQLARQLAGWGLPGNPEQWSLEQTLFAALHTPDAPGALLLGDLQLPGTAVQLPVAASDADFDALADTAASTLPAGSSVGGEQAKFLARRRGGEPVLVKFSPPRGTPFGERWHDLLWLEHLALTVLAEHGVPVAASRIVQTPRRTHLESLRFDRHGAHGRSPGRSHVVPLHAVQDAFVNGPRQHWAATCEALVRQRRLPPEAAAQSLALLQFGRLIGNSDMHFGNLGLRVAAADLARGRFTLAPVYDMLPMRWRPDTASGELGLLPFTPETVDLQSPARAVAAVFWQRAATLPALTEGFRALAATMAARLAAA